VESNDYTIKREEQRMARLSFFIYMRLKIPSGCYKRAKSLGILNEVAFYLECKVMFPTCGYLTFKQYSRFKKEAPQHLGCGRTINRKIKSLQRLGLVNKTKQGFRLASFDSLCMLLKYDMSETKTIRNKVRKGSFKIHRIPLDKIPDCSMSDLMAKLDLQDNLKAQVKAAYVKHRQSLEDDHKEPSKGAGHKYMKEYLDVRTPDNVNIVSNSRLVKRKQQEHELLSNEKYLRGHANLDVTLSCAGFGRMLGTCKKTAWSVFQRLKEANLITIKKRSVVKCSVGDMFKSVEQAHKSIDKDKFHIFNGMIFHNISYKVEVV